MKIKFTLLILSCFILLSAYSQSWTPLSIGLNDKSRVLLNDTVNDKLVVGGDFTYAGTQNANFVATWDGTTWANLGSGFNAPVYALALYNNEIYAGGNFTMSGTDTVKYLAKWNGTQWVSVGTGIANSNVKFLKTYQGKLYISGDFTSYGSIPKKNITWNGTAFDSIAGFPSTAAITDIAFYKFKTYYACGGSLISSNGFTFQYIPGSGGNLGPIYIKTLEVEMTDDLLYVAGTNPNDPYCADVYDGASFQAYYVFNAVYPTDGPINVLKAVGSDMYMGGDFVHADYGVDIDFTVYNITKFKTGPQTFHAMNYGTDGIVRDIELYKNSLYIAGDFVYAGTSTSNFVSKYPCIAPPTVTLSSFSSTCVNSSPITLSTGSPIGGTYSGTGVSSGVFNPAAAGTGVHQITYSYTDGFSSCSATATKPITVSSCGVGIEEETSGFITAIFPNPSSQDWTVVIKENVVVNSMALSDINGKTVWINKPSHSSSQSITIPNKQLVPGIYILKTMIDNTIYVQKLIKQ